jgi:DNA repair ATPase RecN
MFALSVVWKKVILSGLLLAGLVGGALFASPVTSALASSGTDTATPPVETAGRRETRLERLYQFEQNALQRGRKRLNQADTFAGRVQQFIDKMNAQGKDTSGLSKALADFNAAISTARGDLNNASAILTTHAGFDASGAVTDAQQALQTVKSAGKDLRDARQTMRKALIEMRNAVRQFRQANRVTAAPAE